MLHAGLPMLKALRSLERACSGPLGNLVMRLHDSVERGNTFYDAAEQSPLFEPLERRLIQVGERTGSLDRVLTRIAADREFWRKLRGNLLSQMIYPTLVLHVAAAAVTVIGFVARGPTTGLSAGAGILGPLYLLGIVVFVLSKIGHKIPFLLTFADALANALPIIGGVHRKLALARFSRSLASMYDAGIGVPDAVAACAPLCGNRMTASRLELAAEALRSGTGIEEAFAISNAVDGVTLGMIATGEQTGRLDEMLNHVAENAEHAATQAIERVGVLIPVILMLLLALLVGAIIITAVIAYVNMLDELL